MQLTSEQKQRLEQIADQFNLSLVLLFGSRAQSAATPLSDIDIAVLPRLNTPLNLSFQLELLSAFQGLFQTDQVDVVVLPLAGPLLRFEALRGGQVLLERDRAEHAAAHLRALRDYEDTRHFREVQFNAMREHLRRGTFGKVI